MNESTIIQMAIWVAAGGALFVFLKRRRGKRVNH
jgi:hypothetical protein